MVKENIFKQVTEPITAKEPFVEEAVDFFYLKRK